MKIYIDSNLTPRYSLNGWPEKGQFFIENSVAYHKALEKAKTESTELLAPGQFLAIAPSLKPDTFIEVEIEEVEVVEQWKHTGVGGIGWRDGTEYTCWQMSNAGYYTRKVARVKKQENAVDGYTNGMAGTKTLSEVGYERCQRIEVNPLKEQLAAANKKIEELEQFVALVKEMRDAQNGTGGFVERMHAAEDVVDEELRKNILS
jgi:hypothetical protein